MRSSGHANGPTLQQEFGGLYEFAKDVTASALKVEKSPESLLRLIGKLERLAEKEIGRLHERLDQMGANGEGLKPACSRGCWFCCTHVVVATAPEILSLADHVRATWSSGQLSELRERIARHKLLLADFRSGQRSTPPRATCPLLVGGECTAWASRPLVCRGWNSVNVDDCRTKMERPEAEVRERGFAPQVAVADFIRQGHSEALQEQGLSGELCELALGLEIALDDPSTTDRYLRGEDIFAPARAGLDGWS